MTYTALNSPAVGDQITAAWAATVAADLADIQGRVVVNTKITTSTTPAASIDLVVSGTITGDGVKKWRVLASFRMIVGTVAGDVYDVTLQEGATVLKSFRTALISVANGTNGVVIETVLTPSAGAHTFGLSANRVAGTGTLSVYASSVAPIEMTIEQLT